LVFQNSEDLNDLASRPRWNVIQFGASKGWNIKLLELDADKALKRGSNSDVVLVLGAGSSDIRFMEVRQALVGSMPVPNKITNTPKSCLLQLW